VSQLIEIVWCPASAWTPHHAHWSRWLDGALGNVVPLIVAGCVRCPACLVPNCGIKVREHDGLRARGAW